MTEDSIELRDQAGVLRRRWGIVALTVLVALALGLLVAALQTPSYQASAEVLLGAGPDGQSLSTEAVVTEARAVTLNADAVDDELGLQEPTEDLLDTVTVEPDPEGAASVIISATREDAPEAADVANAFAIAYVNSASSRTDDRVAGLDQDIERLDSRISKLTSRARQASADVDLAPTAANRTRLQERRSQRRLAVAQRQQLIDARGNLVVANKLQGQGTTVLSAATTPGTPSSPGLPRILALAAVLGLLAGVALAYLRNYFDDVVHDEDSLGDDLHGHPVLARIPHVHGRAGAVDITRSDPGASASEAYRGLAASMRSLLTGAHGHFASDSAAGTVLLFTSAGPAEGKTSMATNFAVVAAGAGQRVVLVDANLRRPALHSIFDASPGPGLVDVLDGAGAVPATLYEVDIEGLRVLPAGSVPSNPVDLLASSALADLLDVLRHEADLVVVDANAVLKVADALDLARSSDLTVLVVRAGMSRGRDVAEAAERLERAGGTVAGLALNDVSERRTRSTRASQASTSYDEVAGRWSGGRVSQGVGSRDRAADKPVSAPTSDTSAGSTGPA